MQQVDYLARRLVHPGTRISTQQQHLGQLAQRLNRAMRTGLQRNQDSLQRLVSNLQHLNPEAVLARGFSVVRTRDGKIVRNSAELFVNDEISMRFAHGSATARVMQKEEAP